MFIFNQQQVLRTYPIVVTTSDHFIAFLSNLISFELNHYWYNTNSSLPCVGETPFYIFGIGATYPEYKSGKQ